MSAKANREAEVEASVAEAKRIRLDPDRQKIALRRIAAAREVVAYHEQRAAAERATMQVLTRTWELCPVVPDLTALKYKCCGDPEQCKFNGYKAPRGRRARQAVDIVSERT